MNNDQGIDALITLLKRGVFVHSLVISMSEYKERKKGLGGGNQPTHNSNLEHHTSFQKKKTNTQNAFMCLP